MPGSSSGRRRWSEKARPAWRQSAHKQSGHECRGRRQVLFAPIRPAENCCCEAASSSRRHLLICRLLLRCCWEDRCSTAGGARSTARQKPFARCPDRFEYQSPPCSRLYKELSARWHHHQSSEKLLAPG